MGSLKVRKSRKAIYGVLNSSKKRTKLTILSIFFTQDSEFRSFLGIIEKTIICLGDCLTFRHATQNLNEVPGSVSLKPSKLLSFFLVWILSNFGFQLGPFGVAADFIFCIKRERTKYCMHSVYALLTEHTPSIAIIGAYCSTYCQLADSLWFVSIFVLSIDNKKIDIENIQNIRIPAGHVILWSNQISVNNMVINA